ncbi:MAG: chitobiase/beta-hexosaminidase C-terminal domain-containing protein, partial [Candidatus Eremiobacteraeota bacterium]|nr:chitobiase/beta-hexosaminidase C-terminal domain-containing protein [Candidatus Eremiobacteraeota bacterium]
FYMALPRELALSEVLWTPHESKSWNSFVKRLPAQFAWLEAHQYTFRIPNVAFALSDGKALYEAVPGHVQSVRAWTNAPALTVTVSVPLHGAIIRYTTDGARPSNASRAYRGPFVLRSKLARIDLQAAAFLHGRAGAVSECIIVRGSPGPRVRASASTSWSALVSP